MFKKLTLATLSSIIFLAGCTSNTHTPSTVKTTESTNIVVVDLEAAALGFPEHFISHEKKRIDWAEATSEKIAGMDVEVYDTGVLVDVCGGIGCDQ